MELEEKQRCVLKLTMVEPGTQVKIATNVQPGSKPSIIVEPINGFTDESGMTGFSITAINKGIDGVSWAVPNETGEFEFNKKAYNERLAWGMFVKVNKSPKSLY